MRYRSLLWSSLAVLALGLGAGLSPAEGAPKNGHGGGGGGPAFPHGKDTTAPVITCPSGITVDPTWSTGAYVSFTVSATDDKDPSPTIVVNPTSGWFPVGKTTVTVTATDWKNNTSTKSFDVTVNPFTQTILPSSGVRNYKAYWFDADGYSFYDWDITVAADGTVTGSGLQTSLLVVYGEFEQYSAELPAGLSGAGSVSGTIANDGTGQLTSSSTYWYADGFGGEFTEGTTGFDGPVSVSVDSAGNLYFDVSPLASPSYWFDYPTWFLQ